MSDDTGASWSHFNPVRIVAGAGALERLPGLLPADGRVLLVTTAGFTRRGLTARASALVDGTGASRVVVCDRITPNPQLDDLEAIAAGLGGMRFAAVVAIGGGSALDAGKALAVALGSGIERPLQRALREREPQDWAGALPMVAVPTTAGTGAEVTPFATVWDHATQRKHSLVGDRVFPRACVLDPGLTLDLPHDETLYSGLDAVSHALESLWNRHRTPVSEAFALQALERATRALPVVLERPGDLAHRTLMQQASLLSGLAISQTRTAIAHSISYPLTLHHGVPHGLACSFTLAAILERNLPAMAAARPEDRTILEAALAMLHALRLGEHVARYASPAQVHALIAEMSTPGRADNFAFAADVPALLASSMP